MGKRLKKLREAKGMSRPGNLDLLLAVALSSVALLFQVRLTIREGRARLGETARDAESSQQSGVLLVTDFGVARRRMNEGRDNAALFRASSSASSERGKNHQQSDPRHYATLLKLRVGLSQHGPR